MLHNKILKLIKMLKKRASQSRTWETISKEDENGKTTTGLGRVQCVNDIYKNNFSKYRRSWVRSFF